MGVVIIPFDYEQLPEAQRKAIVPICIASVDRHGNPIAAVWFEAAGYCGAGGASTGLATASTHQRYRASDRRFISSCVIRRCSVFSADPGKLMNLKPSV